MADIAQLSQRIQSLVGEAKTLAAKDSLTAAESEQVEAKMAEVKGLKSQIETLKSLGALETELGQSAGMIALAGGSVVGQGDLAGGRPSTAAVPLGFEDAGGAVTHGTVDKGHLKFSEQYGEGLFGAKHLAATTQTAYRESFRDYLRVGERHMKSAALKSLSEGADTAGGFLVPSDVLDRIISREPTPTRIRARVMEFQTARDMVVIPRVNYTTDDLYTTGMRVTWTGEVPASATTMRVTDPIFGQTHIPVYTAMMSILVTNDMVEDSSFPLLSWLSGKFGETIELLYDNMILNGTGVGQPYGILNNPDTTGQPTSVHSGNASALTADGIINLAYALPEQYDDNAVFVMNKTNTANAVALLKDSQNRYLFGMGYQDSGLSPNLKNRQLLGYDNVWSGFAPNVAANAFPIVFGDLRGYYLVNRLGFSVQVLRELYAETNQLLVIGRIRFGGVVAEDFRMRVQKVST